MSDSGKSRVKKPIMNKVPLPATTVVKQQSVPPPVVMQERFEEPRDKRKLIVKTEEEEMESQEQAEAVVKQSEISTASDNWNDTEVGYKRPDVGKRPITHDDAKALIVAL